MIVIDFSLPPQPDRYPAGHTHITMPGLALQQYMRTLAYGTLSGGLQVDPLYPSGRILEWLPETTLLTATIRPGRTGPESFTPNFKLGFANGLQALVALHLYNEVKAQTDAQVKTGSKDQQKQARAERIDALDKLSA